MTWNAQGFVSSVTDPLGRVETVGAVAEKTATLACPLAGV
jgi:hypothetical protein